MAPSSSTTKQPQRRRTRIPSQRAQAAIDPLDDAMEGPPTAAAMVRSFPWTWTCRSAMEGFPWLVGWLAAALPNASCAQAYKDGRPSLLRLCFFLGRHGRYSMLCSAMLHGMLSAS